ncbi:threonine aldolase [Flavobacterium beibuense F44-8]|uniref:Threonine aldolase n=1 Tax=Flavobacterium beibuense F44-8 TaxID=1406840 RepID=A0A0A2LUD2_9FLAO|nr:GntG family PLP-dependent aldolase [Flavobacterium beibuense]KGO79745.1 threonine aldolase [Flavobacterium beibuense F44-8]
MEINLVSDTVTKPSHDMLQHMFRARVGDDVYKQDPTVNELEESVAELFGMEAALFFPSGTMANQTAIKLHTNPGEQVICDKWAHIYNYEGGGASFNSGVSCRLLDGDRGMITAGQVAEAINPPDFYHSPLTSLVSIENTTNKGGGACYDMENLKQIKEVCTANNLKYHLDGARLWNALVARRQHPKQFGELFDTISVCLSKGLGAPVGSVLLGSKEDMNRALRVRKILGGGMRQAGYLAAAGLYALQNNVGRLEEDHKKAKDIGNLLQQLPWIDRVEPVETNILIFSLKPQYSEADLMEKLKHKSIHISSLGKGKLRIVTHLDYKGVMHDFVMETLQKLTL